VPLYALFEEATAKVKELIADRLVRSPNTGRRNEVRPSPGIQTSRCCKLLPVDDVTNKIARVETRIGGLSGAVVALSGGVDSSLLLALAARAIGAERVVAVTAVGPVESEEDLESARTLTRQLEVPHRCVSDRSTSGLSQHASAVPSLWSALRRA
jgi:asparagine synthetase B (glutamine-hydrolysing)